MPQYRRLRLPGGTYFFTVVTYHRQPFLTDSRSQNILADVIREVQLAYPFTMDAWVYLPEHCHCIWTLPTGDYDYSKRWGLIKAGFSRQAKPFLEKEGFCPEARSRNREMDIWQKRFWEHVIRDEADLQNHLNCIHYNPVKHGLVERVQDWPHSSFHQFVGLGMYDVYWGEDVWVADSQAYGE